MGGLFGGGQPAPPPASPLPEPRVTRMPTPTDPDILAAAKRTREAAMLRKGRQSTILTDMGTNQPGNIIGSSGQKLGA